MHTVQLGSTFIGCPDNCCTTELYCIVVYCIIRMIVCCINQFLCVSSYVFANPTFRFIRRTKILRDMSGAISDTYPGCLCVPEVLSGARHLCGCLPCWLNSSILWSRLEKLAFTCLLLGLIMACFILLRIAFIMMASVHLQSNFIAYFCPVKRSSKEHWICGSRGEFLYVCALLWSKIFPLRKATFQPDSECM